MPDTGKEQRRMTASILVKAILEWGGKGTELAEYLGVSPTTISHWRSVGPESQRKPAVPTEEHITKLLGVLNHRIEQNIYYLKQMIHLGGIDNRTGTKFAMTTGEVFQGMSEFCSEKIEANGPGLDEMFNEFKNIQKIGGPSALRSLFDIKASWGAQEAPTVEDISDEPLDLDAIKKSLHVDQYEKEEVVAKGKAYQEFLDEKIREKYLKPKTKERKK